MLSWGARYVVSNRIVVVCQSGRQIVLSNACLSVYLPVVVLFPERSRGGLYRRRSKTSGRIT